MLTLILAENIARKVITFAKNNIITTNIVDLKNIDEKLVKMWLSLNTKMSIVKHCLFHKNADEEFVGKMLHWQMGHSHNA